MVMIVNMARMPKLLWFDGSRDGEEDDEANNYENCDVDVVVDGGGGEK